MVRNMSGCLSCSSGTYTGGGMELFTNGGNNGSGGGAVYEPGPAPSQKGCSLRGQSCMYTAQGMLVCGTPAVVKPNPVQTGTPLYE